MPTPLASYPIISTRYPEEAEQVLSRELAELHFKSVRNQRRFHLQMNGVHLGQTLVGYNEFATDTLVDPGQVDGMFSLAIHARGGPSVFQFENDQVVCSENGVMISASRPLLIQRSAGSGLYMVRVNSGTLQERIQRVLDRRPRNAIVFDSSVDLATGVGAQARRLLTHLVETAQNDPAVLEYPLVRTGFDELLMNVLLSLASNLSDELVSAGRFPAASGLVRRAEEFLEAHANEPITIDDVVRQCNCSRSALFSAFRKHRSHTPTQFLTDVRLRSARKALQAPTPDTTVTTVAYGCGFTHLGRFAEAYRQRFGETPSRTLRQVVGMPSE